MYASCRFGTSSRSGTPVSWPSGTVATNPSGSNPGPEGPSNAIDGNVFTKWLDFNFAGSDQQNGSSQLSIDVGSRFSHI